MNMSRKIAHCKICDQEGHYAYRCWQAKKKSIKPGKHHYKWIETRNRWLEANKAPYYFCYICDKQMTRSQLTLDHIKPRSSYPQLRYVLKNLAPCCWDCNFKKGSKVIA